MIFVTIGTQISFDRFIEAIDEIAGLIDEPIIVQGIKGGYQTKNVKTVDFLNPDEFNKLMEGARLIVGHAGMGTVLSALKYEKPIIIFPRIASLREHRNDHQMVTAMRMNELGYVHVAYDKKQLKALILNNDLKPLKKLNQDASNNMINFIINSLNKN
ncbi:glycosyl transferase family 28 [Pedobacter chinensis]|uniref:Glycosyl transferase family 28 n=1 Tax=Pedobacter chinensis TaxID=2282421 RepID=A0A369PP08_9SPHI|nr:glycosyltransferase [Pedobacter chinensis]RDC54274.1 glycosyl transferase family 28 [Pedobacter chinensis]